MPPFLIQSLRGGLNNSDPPISIGEDQCTEATNVEWVRSTLGERRRGGVSIDLTGSALAGAQLVIWVYRHLPTSDPGDAQLWALGFPTIVSPAVLVYKTPLIGWRTVDMPDPMLLTNDSYNIRGVSLHGKLFLFYKSGINRLHVWENGDTNLRRVGLAALSTAPTAVDTGTGGTYATVRYFRVREAVQVGGVTVRRSEPSNVLTFTPNGSKDGAVVTRPAVVNTGSIGSNCTHWELEESINNADFYRIATVAIGTTTYTDNLASTAVSSQPLSEQVGDYTAPHSAKYGIADDDRLLVFGSWENTNLASSVSWTPVANATGIGNDERITLDPVSTLNLDNYNGGVITDVSSATSGEIWVFKQQAIYKLARTGELDPAYEATAMTRSRGAMTGSVVDAVDTDGHPALYFADPGSGFCRIGRYGIQTCGRDIWQSWLTVIQDDIGGVSCRSVYYPEPNQVHWFVRTSFSSVGSDRRFVLHINETRETSGGVRRGWAEWTGDACRAISVCLYGENIATIDSQDASLILRPVIARDDGSIWRLDVGDDDNGTEYTSSVTTKPYSPTNLQTQFEIKSASLVAKAVSGATLTMTAVPNFGTSNSKIGDTIDCTPSGSETAVIRKIEDVNLAELETVQLTFADVDRPGSRWELARCVMTISTGQGS